VLLILIGLFMPHQNWTGYTLFGVAIIIFLVILYQVGGVVGYTVLGWLGDWWPLIVGLGFIVAVIAIMFGKGKEKPQTPAEKIFPYLFGGKEK
jgi:hypothetical protein